MSKETIGNNPLAAYLGATAAKPKKKNKIAEEEPKKLSKKQRVTIHLDVELINKVKDAVFWEPGMTLIAFAEKALANELKLCEKKRGEKYPERKNHNLVGGRPLR